MQYLNLHTKQILTPSWFKATTGIDPDNYDLVFRAGYALVDYEYPQFDNTFYTMQPQAELTKVDEHHYKQLFDVVYLPVEDVCTNVKAKVTAKRWEVETGGITLPNRVHVLSGVEDQNRIATSIQGMTEAGLDSIDFKASSGWVKLTLTELKAISVALTRHVEACFARECALHKMCDEAKTVEELKHIAEQDLNEGWPTYEVLAA